MRLADFFPRLQRRSLILTALLQLLVIAGAVIGGLSIDVDLVTAIITFGPVVITSIAAAITSVIIALRPTKVITSAITHVSGQPNDVTPPNLNKQRYERSGLKAMVQTVYDLALSKPADQISAQNTPAPINSDFVRQLLNDLPCGIIAYDRDRHIVYANPAAPVRAASDGTLSAELLYEQGSDLQAWLDGVEDVKMRDTTQWIRIANKLPDEADRRIFDVYAYYQKEGASADTILVTVDRTTDYAPAQEDMDFIALAAHELRGPITIIRGYLDVLTDELKPKLEGDQLELMERLNVSANRLSSYVNNILNVSRYDRRHLKLHLHEERIEDIFRGLLDDVSQRARTQNRLLSISIPAGLPTIAADRNSIGEVFTNLIDNAIKYSNEGGQVEVSASVKGAFVELSVRDHGIGIPANVLGNLFTKFYRSHRSRQTVSGTGLGLYLSKAIVESHGGHIAVSSQEGEGSVFSVTLPIYSTVADKLVASDNENKGIIENSGGWIKNHSAIKG